MFCLSKISFRYCEVLIFIKSTKQNGGAMKVSGIIILVIGGIILIISFAMETTVTSYSLLSDNEYYNLGKLNNKTNTMIVSSIFIISGILLLSAGILNEKINKIFLTSKEIKKINSSFCEKCGNRTEFNFSSSGAYLCENCAKEEEMKIEAEQA